MVNILDTHLPHTLREHKVTAIVPRSVCGVCASRLFNPWNHWKFLDFFKVNFNPTTIKLLKMNENFDFTNITKINLTFKQCVRSSALGEHKGCGTDATDCHSFFPYQN